MTLQEAYNLFESLLKQSSNKSEIKLYEKFIHVLNKLKSREFSKDEILYIEAELDSLNLELNHENKKKHFKKALSKFEKFLNDRFSLTPKDYFTRRGTALGITFGILFGIVFLSRFERSVGIAMGLSIGLVIGLLIGRSMDAKAMREGKVI